MSPDSLTRRRTLELTGAVAASAAIAGCSGGTDDTPADGGNGDGGNGGNGSDDVDAESFDGWFDDVDNYDGVEDLTGEDEVTVDVGAGSDGYQFAPPAIRVSTGTTVVWEWTGEGAAHNVVADDGSFESDLTDEAGATFEQPFDETGTYKYYCNPHKTMGMKGVVDVE